MASGNKDHGAVRAGASDETKSTESEPKAKAQAPAPAAPPARAPIDGAAQPAQGGAPVAGEKPVFRYPYVVAEGKSIVTKRGLIGAFGRVKAEDFANGQQDLDALVASGAVVKS